MEGERGGLINALLGFFLFDTADIVHFSTKCCAAVDGFRLSQICHIICYYLFEQRVKPTCIDDNTGVINRVRGQRMATTLDSRSSSSFCLVQQPTTNGLVENLRKIYIEVLRECSLGEKRLKVLLPLPPGSLRLPSAELLKRFDESRIER